MIISCINCNKKFDVNSDLIPKKGRLLECSGCNHQWFFKRKTIEENVEASSVENRKDSEVTSISEREKTFIDPTVFNDEENDNNEKDLNVVKEVFKNKKKTKILNYTLVIIISFTALIILIDTFINPLSKMIPNIEFILYNLYESIKDIQLFTKDLI